MPDREVNMAIVPAEEVNTQVLLTLVRQVLQNQERSYGIQADQSKELKSMAKSNAKMAARLSRLEAVELKVDEAAKTAVKLDARLKTLEDVRQQFTGVKLFMAWLKDYTPWLFAMGIGAYAFFTKQKIDG